MACKLCPCKAARLGGYGLRNVYKSNVFGSAAARTEKEKVSGRHNGGVCTDNRG